mmetsp:Transcript_14710/g.17907  ORF Transcript_14710/g.17907 Transcript_14710/m.17907 type:complete len:102 (-) Transcript_14710:1558-1863(-)
MLVKSYHSEMNSILDPPDSLEGLDISRTNTLPVSILSVCWRRNHKEYENPEVLAGAQSFSEVAVLAETGDITECLAFESSFSTSINFARPFSAIVYSKVSP